MLGPVDLLTRSWYPLMLEWRTPVKQRLRDGVLLKHEDGAKCHGGELGHLPNYF